MKHDPEDRRLVERFLERREEWAFRTLYRRHSSVLYRLILRVVGGVETDAQEVLQATWIRAAEKIDGFRWESSLRSWLVGIAFNCCRELRRRRLRRGNRVGEALLDLERPGPIEDGLTGIDLERAIARLPDGYRDVLVLHDVEGYTHQEIGRILGIEAGTSKSQLSRARRALRAALVDVNPFTGEQGANEQRAI